MIAKFWIAATVVESPADRAIVVSIPPPEMLAVVAWRTGSGSLAF